LDLLFFCEKTKADVEKLRLKKEIIELEIRKEEIHLKLLVEENRKYDKLLETNIKSSKNE
jgi:hypothetical protein